MGRPLKNVRSSLIAFQVIGAIHLLHNFQSHEYFTSLRLLVNVAQRSELLGTRCYFLNVALTTCKTQNMATEKQQLYYLE